MMRRIRRAGVFVSLIVLPIALATRAADDDRELPSLLRSEFGRDSQMRLLQFAAGRDVTYIVAVRREHDATRTAVVPVREWLWPTSRLMPTEIVYDCTEEVLHGKAKPILCDLRHVAVRVFAILPTQVEQIELRSSQTAIAGRTFDVRVEFQDAGRKRLRGMLPFHVELVRPDGELLHDLFVTTELDGTSALSLPVPVDAPVGKWRFEVRSQLNGLTESLPVFVDAGPAAE